MPSKYFSHVSQTKIMQPKYFVALSFLVLSIRMIWYTHQFTVNMMFWDQWFIYNPLFRDRGLVDVFLYQHGPHRQGLGGILIAITATISGWRGEWDAYLVGLTFVFAAFVSIWLKVRLTGRFDWFDMLIPVLFLSLNQWETHTVAPNTSHSALPLALIIIYAIALTIQKPLGQAAVVVVSNFFLMFTGFGLFAALITPLLFLFRTIAPQRNGFDRSTRTIWFSSFLLSLATLGLFFSDWVYTPAVDCIDLSRPALYEYVMFAGLQIGQGFAIVPVAGNVSLFVALGIGLSVMVGAIIIVIHSLRQQDNMVIPFLIVFSLIFVAATAVGRICLGVTSQPLSSKYSTLVLPLILGIYLWANTKGKSRRQPIGITLTVLVILSFTPPFYRNPYSGTPQDFYISKQTWKTCYLETFDIAYCDQLAGFPIHPYPEYLPPLLQYLEKHNLNLFRDLSVDARMNITNPPDQSLATTDQIVLRGTINPPDFDYFHVQWGIGELPDEWFWLSGPHLSPVVDDSMITRWDMTGMSAGTYTVRVTAFAADGHRIAAITRIVRQ